MPLSEFPLPHADETSGNEPPEIRAVPPGPLSRSASARLEKVECPAYAKRREDRAAKSGADMAPIVLASGRGSNLYDVDGNRYVDLAAGFGSALLGHGATAVTRAVEGQVGRLVQALGDVYSADAKIALLERLASLTSKDGGSFVGPRTLLGLSGSDAVTAALKTAVLATGRPGVVAFEGAYHGLGYAPLAACGLRESYRAPFAAQLNPSVRFAPYARTVDDVDRSLSEVEAALRDGDVGAIVVEPILGRGGCVVPPIAFLRGVCDLAHAKGALVIADEIWTGLGRAGSFARSFELGLPIDVLCLGKGLGGGLPISACIAGEAIMRAWAREGEVVHTSTHSGLPLSCAVAVSTLDALRFRSLADRSKEIGLRTKIALESALAGAPGFVAVHGVGLMIGVELTGADVALRAVRGLLERGYVAITGGTAGEVVTFTPALTIHEELLVSAAAALRQSL